MLPELTKLVKITAVHCEHLSTHLVAGDGQQDALVTPDYQLSVMMMMMMMTMMMMTMMMKRHLPCKIWATYHQQFTFGTFGRKPRGR